MTIISTSLSGSDEKSRLARQTDIANQRDSWLRQMELAELTGMGQSGKKNTSGESANKPALSTSWSAILHRRPINPAEERPAPSSLVLPPTERQIFQNENQHAPATDAGHAIVRDRIPESSDTPNTVMDLVPGGADSQVNQSPIEPPVEQSTPVTDKVGAIEFEHDSGNSRDDTGRHGLQPAPMAVSHQDAISGSGFDAEKAGPIEAALFLDDRNTTATDKNQVAIEPRAAGSNALIQSQEQASGEAFTPPPQPPESVADDVSDSGSTAGVAAHVAGAALFGSMSTLRAQAVQEISVQQNIDSPRIQATQSRIPTSLSTTAAIGDGTQQEPASASEEMQQEAPASDAPLEEKTTWQKRLMHVTGEGEDVKLWIRDSKLNAAQTQNLVYRLAGDIAGMGMRLKDATVNGKLAFRSEADDDAGKAAGTRNARRGMAPSSIGPQTQQAIDSINLTMEEEHGSQ